MFLIVGLGNPGAKYARTRHNAGWFVIDELARRHGIDVSRKAHEAHTGTGFIGEHKIMLAKPLTFMNLSGRAVSALMRYNRIEQANIIVVTDDLNLPLGRLRLRKDGSDGGHNGLKSITQFLSSNAYPRLRFGIGEPPREERVERGTADHVLSLFAPDEWPLVDQMTTRSSDCIETFVQRGIEAAMNEFNRTTS
ncbi:MAG TPA: aminoacyl-tRNA hydrolase [Abditibacteriaceae bacterium]|jgi:PTH1 family peptidyl-tRNA hydrolase